MIGEALQAAPRPGQEVSLIAHKDFETAMSSWSVAVGDFNGDGALDLAVAAELAGKVLVLLGIVDGSFQRERTIASGGRPMFVALGDFNGDRMDDLAVANFGSANARF
jgi:hypothetical protein